ncbi:hypothetical protein [Derxia gummosa]|uniref:Lipoprotein n=1 Tax=Derxia gummosa DSM 723 TaxID=1121388 RepID=A0A8B6X6X4_9BURK|nr:hypothetical protein [Derxia gummosa]
MRRTVLPFIVLTSLSGCAVYESPPYRTEVYRSDIYYSTPRSYYYVPPPVIVMPPRPPVVMPPPVHIGPPRGPRFGHDHHHDFGRGYGHDGPGFGRRNDGWPRPGQRPRDGDGPHFGRGDGYPGHGLGGPDRGPGRR